MRESDIDAHLKRAFQELADEALPDRFNDLLAKLRAGEGSEPESASGGDGGLNGTAHGLAQDTRSGPDEAEPTEAESAPGRQDARAMVHDASGAQRHSHLDEAAKPVTVDAAGARQRK